MQYIYAALLLHKAGKEINEENLKKVIEAAGISPDDARVKTVVASLKGVDIEKALQEAVMPIAAPTAGVAQAQAQKAEEKKEEKPEEAAEGLAALFG
ncbi:MAG: 50S ribosomal protein P1 [Candidatus Pacearchaeota archaeon]|nr:50S ribosomal protein P1 [Candidatus Pacearchaeota archaeon]